MFCTINAASVAGPDSISAPSTSVYPKQCRLDKGHFPWKTHVVHWHIHIGLLYIDLYIVVDILFTLYNVPQFREVVPVVWREPSHWPVGSVFTHYPKVFPESQTLKKVPIVVGKI